MTKKLLGAAIAIAFSAVLLPVQAGLDYSWWTNSQGRMDYFYGTADFDVKTAGANPWTASWGKDLAVKKDKVYVVRFDAQAANYAGQTETPISLRIHQNYSPWTHATDEKTVKLAAEKRHYEVELYSTRAESNAVLAVWVAHAAAYYHFENLSITEKDPALVQIYHPLDQTYWSNSWGYINRPFGYVDFNVAQIPSQPWVASWGKDLAVTKDKIYTLSFDASAKNSASTMVPFSVRINQNYSPWLRYSQEKTLYLEPTQKHYDIDLYATASDPKSEIAVWLGHAVAVYHFENVSVTEKAPIAVESYEPLDYSWWSNISGALNYALGTINLSVASVPDQPWRYCWGRDMAVEKGRTYVVSFDAMASPNPPALPVTLRLHANTAPYASYTPAQTVNIAKDKTRYTVELTPDTSDNNAVLAIWAGHAAGNYRFENIKISIK